MPNITQLTNLTFLDLDQKFKKVFGQEVKIIKEVSIIFQLFTI